MLFVLKVIDGVRKRVAQIRYNNGTVVERVYPIVGNVPEDVRVIQDGKSAKNTEDYNPHAHDHIVNQEFLQYQYHFGGQ